MNAKSGIRSTTDQALEPCFRLIYRSRSLMPDGEAGLAEILHDSRINNRKLGVTGALMLYEEKGRFAQVLEGPEDIVQGLFDKIKGDPRHDSVALREAEAAPGRLFSQWAMALVAEHHEQDMAVIAVEGGLAEAAPWHVTAEQEKVLSVLRDITRGYGRSY